MSARDTFDLDVAIDDLEVSVRTSNVLRSMGIATLRQARDNMDMLKNHAKGFGSRSQRELKELIQYAERSEVPLFDDPEYRAYLRTDRLETAQKLVAEAERQIFQAALRGSVSAEIRTRLACVLRDAAACVEQIPVLGGA